MVATNSTGITIAHNKQTSGPVPQPDSGTIPAAATDDPVA